MTRIEIIEKQKGKIFLQGIIGKTINQLLSSDIFKNWKKHKHNLTDLNTQQFIFKAGTQENGYSPTLAHDSHFDSFTFTSNKDHSELTRFCPEEGQNLTVAEFH